MMKRLLPVLVLLVLVGCGSTPTTPTTANQSDEKNLVVNVKGALSIKRTGWKEFAPLLFGMVVHPGDLLKVDSGAQTTVVCADLTRVDVQRSGLNPAPCMTAQPVLTYKGSVVAVHRGGPSTGPTVVAPRQTKILDPHPTLRWTPVQGAPGYIVTVTSGGANVWSKQVGSVTELKYPDTAPPLQPGTTYKLTVTVNGQAASDDSTPGYQLLTAEEAQAIQQSEQQVRALNLDEQSMHLVIANLFASKSLFAEAIEQLGQLAQASATPAVLQTLGDLYLKVDLPALAESSYKQAADLAKQTGATESQAVAQDVLGDIYSKLGRTADAVAVTKDASTAYHQLGDAASEKKMQDRLASLQKP